MTKRKSTSLILLIFDILVIFTLSSSAGPGIEFVREFLKTGGAYFLQGKAPLIAAQAPGKTFLEKPNREICTKDGKPIIRLFASSQCPECKPVEEAFLPVAKEYMGKNLVAGHLWHKDTGDDLLTPETETQLPYSEEVLCFEFDSFCNTPLLVFGCRFFRKGHPQSIEEDKAEMKEVIEKLLSLIQPPTPTPTPGEPTVTPTPTPSHQRADITGDGYVDGADASILVANWGVDNPYPKADLNQDGKVDALDASILVSNWNPR